MSTISNALARANAIIARVKGETLSYSTTFAGTYTDIPDFVFDRDEPIPATFDGYSQAEAFVSSGRVSGPVTPVLAEGAFIKDSNGHIFAIERVDFDQQQLASVKRTVVDNGGLDRGGAS